MNVAYVRVSSISQNESRQVEALEKYNIDKWFSEKISGKNTDRPKLQEMIEYVREGDCIYILDFSRLARSTEDLLHLVDTFQEKGVKLVSLKENLDTSTPQGRLMLTLIAAINQFERECIRERQAEGIAIAKAEGRYQGRPTVNIDDDTLKDIFNRYTHREINKSQMAKELNVSRPTLDKLLKDKGYV